MAPSEPRRITRILPQRKKGRFTLYLDGAFAFGVDASVVFSYGLQEGELLTPERIAEIEAAELLIQAKAKALRWIAYRPRSVAEIRKRLAENGFTPAVIDRVIEDFLRVGLLNDAQFAAAYVASRQALRPVSWRRLAGELRARGVPPSVITHTLGAYQGDAADLSVAKELIQKKMRRDPGCDPMTLRRRLCGFLARRGFSWEVISEAVHEALGGTSAEDD